MMESCIQSCACRGLKGQRDPVRVTRFSLRLSLNVQHGKILIMAVDAVCREPVSAMNSR